jgi:PAS domain S-box-containing protein
VCDRHAYIQWVNPAFLSASGHTLSTLIGRDYLSLSTEGAGFATLADMRQAMRQGELWRGQALALRADNSTYVDDRSITPLRDDKRRLTGFVVVGDDVTERNRQTQAAQDAARRMKALLDAAPDAIITINQHGEILLANPQVTALFGYRPEELIGRSVRMLMPPQYAAWHDDYLRRCIQHGPQALIGSGRELLALRKDGTLVNIHLSVGEAALADGRVFIGFLRDITERLRSREALAEREARYRMLMNTAADGVWLVDDRGYIMAVNEAYARDSGYDKAELEGMHVSALEGHEQPDEVAQHIRRIAQRGHDVFETLHRRKDGSLWHAEISVTYATGKEGLFFAFIRDISARKHQEENLRRSEAKLRLLFERSPLGIALTDMAGRLLDTNQAYQQMTGYSSQELRQLSFWDLTPESHLASESAQIADIQNKGGYGPYEKEYLRKDGTLIPVRLNGVRLDLDGQPHVWSFVEDLTETRQLERERHLLQHKQMQSQKLEALGQLTGGVAHDFNNMLAGIMGLASLGLEHHVTDPNSKLARYLREIVRTSERGRDLVAKMLSYARTEAHEDAAPRLIGTLVSELHQMLASSIPSGIALTHEIAPNLPPVRISAVDLHQIVMNLVLNARDALGAHGHIQIKVSEQDLAPQACLVCHETAQGGHVVLEVTDDGPGIPDAMVTKVFDPFFTTKGVGKGTGLGLSSVQGIVHKVGGHLQVITGPHGTTMRILLPVSTDGQTAPDSGHGELHPLGEINVPSPSVWVVDDDLTVLVYLTDLLQAQGFEVRSFSDPRDALGAFQRIQHWPEALITDQTMPGISGDELARAVLAMREDFPIILCTGYSDHIDEGAALALGIRSFLRKPFANHQLLTALAGCMTATA